MKKEFIHTAGASHRKHGTLERVCRSLRYFFAAAVIIPSCALADNLVILHTNDTHSMIDADRDGKGGVLQRKAIIDSIRKVEKNVMLIDAGDAVQGTLYFNFFKGDVEYPVMNMLGYDIRTLGNHEFDNGIEDLARRMKTQKATLLSANYDTKGTPLEGLFRPYVIKKIAGKKVGFFALNVDPESLIASANIPGVQFKSAVETANATAAMLRKQGCDLVVAVSHLGAKKENAKEIDYDVARASKDIDIIIGGHSHTVIKPGQCDGEFPSVVDNADGQPVLIAQTGKYGKYLGYIKIDLDALKKADRKFDYQLIPVTDRFDPKTFDPKLSAFIAPYRAKVDSVNNRVIAYSLYDLDTQRTGGYANWAGDFAVAYGRQRIDSLRAAGTDIADLDFAIMNVGGIRQPMRKGIVTEGQMLATFPFSNHLVIAKAKGADIIEALRVAAKKGGEAVSDQLRILTDADRNLTKVLLNGREMDPGKEYVYATIDYLFWGNDDLKSLANSQLVWRDDVIVGSPIMKYTENFGRIGLPIAPDQSPRFLIEQKSN